MKRPKHTVTVALLVIIWTCRAFTSSQSVLAFLGDHLTPDQAIAAKIVPTSTEYQVFYPIDDNRHPRRTVRDGNDNENATFQACGDE